MGKPETSIKIKKFYISDISPDGGMGSNFVDIVEGQREATVQFNGESADKTPFKNVRGDILEQNISKGPISMNFQLADLTPDIIADLTGGTVVNNPEGDTYEAPENKNQLIEKSLMFVTDKDVVVNIPRAQVDAFPSINDDDLHNFTIESTVLDPEKAGEKAYDYTIVKDAAANDITEFSLAEQTGAATIDTSLHTVAIEVATGTSVTALKPNIKFSKGAISTPGGVEETDFTAPVVYTVTAIDGTTQAWTVTVTVAA